MRIIAKAQYHQTCQVCGENHRGFVIRPTHIEWIQHPITNTTPRFLQNLTPCSQPDHIETVFLSQFDTLGLGYWYYGFSTYVQYHQPAIATWWWLMRQYHRLQWYVQPRLLYIVAEDMMYTPNKYPNPKNEHLDLNTCTQWIWAALPITAKVAPRYVGSLLNSIATYPIPEKPFRHAILRKTFRHIPPEILRAETSGAFYKYYDHPTHQKLYYTLVEDITELTHTP